MEMISVVNDWTWVREHAEKMIKEDEQLEDEVIKVARENGMEVVNIIELYHEGLLLGQESTGEEGKYLSFKDWFYGFYQF